MPSLNSRTPCPSPFITSGIFRPPRSTRMTMAIINRCIGLSHISPYLSRPGMRNPSPPTLPSKYNTLVSRSPCHVLAVQVLQQRNRILPADPGKVLECRDRQPVAALLSVLDQQFAQSRQRRAMEHQVLHHFHQHFLPQKDP